MLANNRRKAANAVGTSALTVDSPFSKAKERRALVPTLSEHDQKMLEDFKTTTKGQTEADVFTVFRCRPVASQGRVAVETDIPPLLVAEAIIGLDEVKNQETFALPTHTIQNPTWKKAMVPFDSWLMSRVRYPEVDSFDRQKIMPSQLQLKAKKLSRLDQVETYFAVFHATLLEYFFNRKPESAKLAWQVLRAAQYVIREMGPAKPLTENEKKTLLHFVGARDASEQEATAYKEYVGTLHPAQYYSAMYSIMRTNPELVHKSQIVNIESIIWGYLTQNQLPYENSLPLSALDTDILRLTIERGLQKASLPSNPKCATLPELVQFCHERMGTRLQNMLRTTCQTWSTLRVLDTQTSISWPAFQAAVGTILEATGRLEGIMSYCLVIDPKTTLADEGLAEMWLAKCQAEAKFATLHWKNEKAATPCLDRVIQKTLEDARKAQEAVEEVKQQLQVLPDPDELLQKFTGHVFSTSFMEAYGRLLYSLAQNPENIPVLEQVMKKCRFMSKRRQVTFVLRSVEPSSPVFSHFLRSHDRFGDMTRPGRKGWMNLLLWKIRVHVPESELEIKAPSNEIIQFVPFQVSRELSEKVAAIIKSIKMRAECPICFSDVRKMIVLHEDVRHLVCETCVKELDVCPFCREAI